MDSSALARLSNTQSDNCEFLITPHRYSEGGVCEVFVLNAHSFEVGPKVFPSSASASGLRNLKHVNAES